jgi:hypothetical protein
MSRLDLAATRLRDLEVIDREVDEEGREEEDEGVDLGMTRRGLMADKEERDEGGVVDTMPEEDTQARRPIP